MCYPPASSLLRRIAALTIAVSISAFAAPPATPSQSVRATRSYGWLPWSADEIVLWLGVEEPYLIGFAAPCPDLRTVRPAALTTHQRRLAVGIDTLAAGAQACKIKFITRADPATLDAQPGRTSKRLPIPLIPAAPTTDAKRHASSADRRR